MAFTGEIFAGAKALGLHTAIETSGFLGDRVDDEYLSNLDLVLLDIKSSNPETYKQGDRPRSRADACVSQNGLRRSESRSWVRFTLVPGHTDDPDNVEGIARFVAPMKNVEWVEVQPFHQIGRFQVEGDGAALRTREYASAHPELDQPRDRAISRGGLQRPLTFTATSILSRRYCHVRSCP